ncbi:unnamed protein product [Lasius platythorax]|uniref:Uncharacterized protein n=1 Tax=Lasius platythorax TaxID=488582 RepID=A0AAV2P7G7_9HYME
MYLRAQPSQDRRGTVGEDAVPARGKASVSDATPLWSDRSDPARRSSYALAERNRTRGATRSDSSRHVPLVICVASPSPRYPPSLFAIEGRYDRDSTIGT